jgi:hypothetical protein
MPLAQTFRRNGDAEANRKTALCPCDRLARITWHRISHLFTGTIIRPARGI